MSLIKKYMKERRVQNISKEQDEQYPSNLYKSYPPSSFDGMTELPTVDFVKHSVGSISDIYYIPDAITEEYEQYLINRINMEGEKEGCWKYIRSRRLQCHENTSANQLPTWLDHICNSVVNNGVFDIEHKPNHILINDYQSHEGFW